MYTYDHAMASANGSVVVLLIWHACETQELMQLSIQKQIASCVRKRCNAGSNVAIVVK